MKPNPTIIGFTSSPDGRYYLNLQNFRQLEVTRAEWEKAREGKGRT
jgi:hypothetical protein